MATTTGSPVKRRPKRPRGQGGLGAILTKGTRLDLTSLQSGWGRRLKRAGYLIALTVVPMVLLAAAVVLVVQVRLQHGPVSLKAFAGIIESGISAELGDFSASIGDLQAVLAPDGHLEFRLKDIEIKDADGDLVASAPLAAFELSRSAMWRMRAVPERVYLIDPRVALFYSRDSGLSLSFASTERREGTGGEASKEQGGEGGSGAGNSPAPDTTGPLRNAPLQGQIRLPPQRQATITRRIDFARLVAINSARARRGKDATSYLREFGLRNATVLLDYEGKRTDWRVEEFSIDLEHMQQRSVISGLARVASDRGPWVMTFRTEDSEETRSLNVKASVRDLVPSALGQSLPDLSLLQTLDLPVAGDASLQLRTNGVIKQASIAVELGRGDVRLPSLPEQPIRLDAGLIHLDYDADARRLTMAPSTIAWGASRVTVVGEMTGQPVGGGEVEWSWTAGTREGALAAEEFGVAGIPIESGRASGVLRPHLGELEVSSFETSIGGTGIVLSGKIDTLEEPSSLTLEGTSSPMPVAVLKALWPRSVAPLARQWAGTSITAGNLGAGTFKIATGRHVPVQEGAQSAARSADLFLAVEASDIEAAPPDVPGTVVAVPRALIRIGEGSGEIAVPEATLKSPLGKVIPFKGLRLALADINAAQPMGAFSGRTQAALQPFIEIVRSKAGATLEPQAEVLDGLDGKVEAEISATIPLAGDAELRPVNLAGKAKITDLRSKSRIGPLELQGGTIDLTATDKDVTAAGDLLLNGVLARLDWKRSLEANAGERPPARIVARLDNSDRIQLGLDINHIVQGDVDLEIAVAENPAGAPKIRVNGNLEDAELGIHDLAWKKPKGQPAKVEFDVAQVSTGNIELQNFKVVGENIGIEGWLSIDAENEVREFYFPDFSLNVVSRLEVQGKLSQDKIWSIKAKGPTFDGRDFFRKLVSLGDSDEGRIKPLRPSAGIDVEADIGSIIGQSETSLRGVKIKMSERADKLVGLNAEGKLDGGRPLSVVMKGEADQTRVLSAVTSDAGQMFKLVGFYRNMEKGRAQIEVNLDAKGAADKSGYLWIEDFRILGDPIVSEVVSNTPETGPSAGGKGKRKVVREQLDFNRLFARFSAGHKQLVLEDAAVKGPLLGATIRGKIDHGTQRLSLGGTYVPLQGINAAFCNIPVVGQIITGTSCEGLLGITYAIQGPLSNPQVIVNPFSIAAPGIFREIFQMTTPNPRIQPRSEEKPASSATERVGTSASPVARGSSAKGVTGEASTIDGWSMDTSSGSKKK